MSNPTSNSQQAPQIPNLNSLRAGSRGGLRGLASRIGGQQSSLSENASGTESAQAKRDKIIQQTDNDASLSRMSAVEMGYLHDDFGRYFIHTTVPKRYPIINRGTYVRTTAIDRLVTSFLDTNPTGKKQIISLGAGSDTRFFRLCPERKSVVYHELDFPTNTTAKITAIQQTRLLDDTLSATLDDPTKTTINADNSALYSDTLNIHPVDLRVLTSAATAPTLPNLDPDLPTLLLSECCLCYIPPEATTAILNTLLSFLSSSTPAAIVLYEPVRPNDSFGKVMVSNLSSRGIELRTVKRYATLAAQRERLKLAGFNAGQGARGVDDIYYGQGEEEWLEKDERARVEALEWLDEVEEWTLLGHHYCISWGWRSGVDDIFGAAWSNVKGHYTRAEDGDEHV